MSTKRKKNSTSPLRAALAKKTSLRTWFDMSIASTEEVDKAQRRVDVARQLVAATMLHTDADVVARADQALEEALAARDALFHRIWFRGLGDSEFDALVALHPPTKEQAASEAKWMWNPDTFNYALLAAAAEGDLTAEEWAEELADESKWSRADRAALLSAALAATQQTMAGAVPKD